VLLGSTEKMGVGTNVQARAIALHHLDCPWRPADIAQREGRILRQGNLNPVSKSVSAAASSRSGRTNRCIGRGDPLRLRRIVRRLPLAS